MVASIPITFQAGPSTLMVDSICKIEEALHVELIVEECLPVKFVIAPFQLQSTIGRIFVVEVPSFVVDNNFSRFVRPQHSQKMLSQPGILRDMPRRNQDVRCVTVRPEFLGFDFTDAASRTHWNVPEAIEINGNCRYASSVRRGCIDMVFGAFTPSVW
jgi:hypothetical protein